MKLSTASIYFSLVLLFVLLAQSYAIREVQEAYDNVVEAQLHRNESVKLTNDLRIETAQLAQLVRLYTATSEPRYLLYYYDIISIRNGHKLAPPNYIPATFWDDVIADKEQYKPLVKQHGRSFSSKMEGLGFSAEELQLFNRILKSLDDLSDIEQIAFAATQGLYDVQKREFVSDGIPELAFANRLVFSEQYNQQKAGLSQVLQALAREVESRTQNQVKQATDRLSLVIKRTTLTLVVNFVLIFLSYMLFRFFVLSPIRKLSQAADKIAGAQYETRVNSVTGAEELILLGDTLNHMSESIEDDIKAREEAQKELEEANQRAQEATKAKSMFLANMSHEIRTPMNAIIGMAYLTLKTKLDQKQTHYIETIHNAGQSLLSIINDILDFSKIEAGKIELEQTLFRIEDVIGSSLSLIKASIQQKDVELLFRIEEPFLLGNEGCLIGDPVRLGQVINNLLSNAAKFTDSGQIMLTVNVINRDDNGVTLRFTVEDTGIGMSDDQVSRLFSQFTQADSSTTRKYGGTGLGLTISKNLVELMNGQIQVESTLGKGTTFTFMVDFALESGSLTDHKVHTLKTGRVLIVDDNKEASDILSGMLQALRSDTGVNQDIDVTGSAVNAIEMIKQASMSDRPYEVVFLDWVMPVMDGGDFLDAISELQGVQIPEIIVVSAHDFDLVQEHVNSLGIQYFLSKPVLPKSLRRIFDELSQTGEGYIESIAAKQDYQLQDMQVLLVEDNPTNQILAVELLNMEGIKVDIANNGQEALDKVLGKAAEYYQAVLMDLQMPVMDGYEATRQIRMQSDFNQLPVIAMTAHAMVEAVQQGADVGMNGYITKPISPDELYSTLQQFYKHVSATHSSRPVPKLTTSIAGIGHLTCLDTRQGLMNSAGRADLYQRVLFNFLEDFTDLPRKVATLLLDGDWEQATIRAHSLVGLAGTIGAKQLAPIARALELACQDNDKSRADTQLAKLSSELDPVLSEIQQLQVTKNYSCDKLKEDTDVWIGSLMQLLSDGDAEAIELWGNNYKSLTKTLSQTKISHINQCINSFDFDGALSLLDDIG